MATPHSNTMIRMGAPNSEHNMIISTDGATLLDAGQDWDITVGANLSSYVKGEAAECFHGPHKINSQNTRIDEVNGACTEIYHSPLTQVMYATQNTTVSGTHTLTTGSRTDHVKGDLTQTVDGNITVTSAATKQTWQGNLSTMTQGASHSVNIGAKASFALALNLNVEGSDSVNLFVGGKFTAQYAINVSVTGGAKADFGSAYDMRAAPACVTLAATDMLLQAGGMIAISAPQIMIPAASIVLL